MNIVLFLTPIIFILVFDLFASVVTSTRPSSFSLARGIWRILRPLWRSWVGMAKELDRGLTSIADFIFDGLPFRSPDRRWGQEEEKALRRAYEPYLSSMDPNMLVGDILKLEDRVWRALTDPRSFIPGGKPASHAPQRESVDPFTQEWYARHVESQIAFEIDQLPGVIQLATDEIACADCGDPGNVRFAPEGPIVCPSCCRERLRQSPFELPVLAGDAIECEDCEGRGSFVVEAFGEKGRISYLRSCTRCKGKGTITVL